MTVGVTVIATIFATDSYRITLRSESFHCTEVNVNTCGGIEEIGFRLGGSSEEKGGVEFRHHGEVDKEN
jgi:hypothetical protein